MGFLRQNNQLTRCVILLVSILFFALPLSVWSAGYQEDKLFDGEFYTPQELASKIENHEKEMTIIDNEIVSLEKGIDWTVLKINQIQDSGRTAPYQLKDSIPQKEKKIQNLMKTRTRLEYLIQHYSARLGTQRHQKLEEIYQRIVPQTEPKAEIEVQKIQPVTPEPSSPPVQSSAETDSDPYDGISKAELQSAIDKSGLSDWVEIVGTGTCLRLETTLPILFPTGSAAVAEEYRSFFKNLADFLKPYDVKVLVNGYADTVPINNTTYPSNFELGATRAANIVHQLVNFGLKPSIFKVESTGKHRFSAKGMSDQKALERRAEVTVIFSG